MKTVKELKVIAKEKGIKGWYNMKKAELENALKAFEEKAADVPTPAPKRETADYVKQENIGKFVAYTNRDGLDTTGKIIDIDAQNKTLTIMPYKIKDDEIVPIASVLWIKTGTRWPKWVYQRFTAIQSI